METGTTRIARDPEGLVQIDGSQGEGGGQMLRTALGLSMVSGRGFRMVRIRARRSRPGLLRQHATSIAAAAAISGARVEGGEVGSAELLFVPGRVRAGRYELAVGSAGSTTLVLHAILPGLLLAQGESEVRISGGTDAKGAPSFDHLAEVYLPLLRAMGAEVEATLERRGFYPAGGGRVVLRVRGGSLRPIDRLERGAIEALRITARVAGGLPRTIAERELAALRRHPELARGELRIEEVGSAGPGNTLEAHLRFATGNEVFTSFGAYDVSSEQVAQRLASAISRFLEADVPVSEHTADQLVLLAALAGGGSFRTVELSEHSRTQHALLPAFLPVRIETEALGHRRLVRVLAE